MLIQFEKKRGKTEAASMGPRSSDRGYAPRGQEYTLEDMKASMGPRSSDRGYDQANGYTLNITVPASMGPRSSDRGYVQHS